MKKFNVYWDERGITPLPMYYRTLLKQVIRAGVDNGCEISLSFVSADEIRQLNNQYRQKNASTDVLSFPADSSGIITGDIVICPEIAIAQASEYGHSVDREMAFLTAHGLLHLMGYDHSNPEEETAMIDAQNAILEKVGISR